MNSHNPTVDDPSLSNLPARTIKAGMTYFMLVFGAGFVLGSVRVLLLVPRLGERAAELIEMPFMFVVVLVSARFIIKRFSLPANALPCLGAGFLALCLLVVAEIILGVALQDQTLGDYLASRDPVSGIVYLVMLVLFAVMPFPLARAASASDVQAHPSVPPGLREKPSRPVNSNRGPQRGGL